DLRSTEVQAAAAELAAVEILFAPARSQPLPGQGATIRAAATTARRAAVQARTAHVAACVEVTGYADSMGPLATNEALSRARADWVAKQLAAGGVDRSLLVVRGAGVRSGVLDESARSVTLRLRENRTGAACEGR